MIPMQLEKGEWPQAPPDARGNQRSSAGGEPPGPVVAAWPVPGRWLRVASASCPWGRASTQPLLCLCPRWWRRSLCCPSCTASWSTAVPPPTLPSATPSPTRSARRCWRSWTAASRSAGTCLPAGAHPPCPPALARLALPPCGSTVLSSSGCSGVEDGGGVSVPPSRCLALAPLGSSSARAAAAAPPEHVLPRGFQRVLRCFGPDPPGSYQAEEAEEGL